MMRFSISGKPRSNMATRTKGIMYKEYMLYRQMNEDDLAYSTLKKMYEMYPDDYDITLP